MEEQETLNLVQKLAKVRGIADVVMKDKKGFTSKYADITAILAKVTAGMKKYGVSLVPHVVPQTASVSQITTTNTKFDKTGKPYDNVVTEMLVKADMVFRWINDENPSEYMDVPWFVAGSQGDPSQAFGSGLTYCTRYFLCNFFQIAQPETDVDAYRTKQKEAEIAEDREIAAEIIDGFDGTVRKYLADNPDSAEDVKAFISRYVKKADYKAIKEPTLAAKLVEDFNKNFIKGDE